MDITPSKEFLEAYTRVTGSTDHSPRAVITALRSGLMHQILEAHDEIMQAKLDDLKLNELPKVPLVTLQDGRKVERRFS